MEILPGIHEIRSVLGGRPLHQYLFVGESVVLVDAGVHQTPASVIFPYFETIGLSPRQLTMVIGMHADVDHHGGLSAIKEVSPFTLLACHDGDKQLIEDPHYLYQNRYNFLAYEHELGLGSEVMAYCPRPCKIDALLSAEDTIQLAQGWRLRMWHVPGHSDGHLAVYDEKHRAAFTSDAVQTNGYATVDGAMAFGPTYYSVNAYLATIQFLEGKEIDHMFTGHWPALHGYEVQAFLASSRDFVERADAELKRFLATRCGGATLKQMISALSPRLGTWPNNGTIFLQFALYGHLTRMEQAGIVRRSAVVPPSYILV
jgi:glyoxylase-like metal-dependent hydrolase (beta-lactamase superfamily II)